MQQKFIYRAELRKNQLLTSDLSQSGFEGNDEKTQFYTGFPTFSMLMQLFTLIAPHVVSTSTNALCQFQEYLLVLIRLRLNVPLQDLAYRFKVSVSTASRVFNRWIDVMRVRLDFLIQWPEREELRKTMPLVFRQNFGLGVAVIIDCFEIFTDRPSSLIARAMTWSNYKHHNTVKLLIGITPQGVISFLSKAWGGRVSDKHLTENCGLLTSYYQVILFLQIGDLTLLIVLGFTKLPSKYLPSLVERGNCQLMIYKKLEKLQMFAYMSRELLVWLGESM